MIKFESSDFEVVSESHWNMSASQSEHQLADERTLLLPTSQNEEAQAGFGKPSRGASFPGSVFNLSCTVIGSGIMSLPATLNILGLIPGVALIIIAAFLTEASIDFLLRFSKPGSAFSYGDVMGEAFGKVGKFLLQSCVIINNIGSLTVYMIIIGEISMLFLLLLSFTNFCQGSNIIGILFHIKSC